MNTEIKMVAVDVDRKLVSSLRIKHDKLTGRYAR